jgi:hypothetical protein
MNLPSHRHRLLARLDDAHAEYYRKEAFGGLSLHFHLRALESGSRRDFDSFAEHVYGVLASWGMHRMGPGGSKMRDFAPFSESLASVWPTIVHLQGVTPEAMDADEWSALKDVFVRLKCMASGTSLVGNSKVLADALPALVPPVDREYTLKMLFGHGNIKNDIESEWRVLELVLREFFYPIVCSESFKASSRGWAEQPDRFRWDTSPLKVADNVVIGLARLDRAV